MYVFFPDLRRRVSGQLSGGDELHDDCSSQHTAIVNWPPVGSHVPRSTPTRSIVWYVCQGRYASRAIGLGILGQTTYHDQEHVFWPSDFPFSISTFRAGVYAAAVVWQCAQAGVTHMCTVGQN